MVCSCTCLEYDSTWNMLPSGEGAVCMFAHILDYCDSSGKYCLVCVCVCGCGCVCVSVCVSVCVCAWFNLLSLSTLFQSYHNSAYLLQNAILQARWYSIPPSNIFQLTIGKPTIFPWSNLWMLSAKQGSTKHHFKNLWYDPVRNWTHDLPHTRRVLLSVYVSNYWITTI